ARARGHRRAAADGPGDGGAAARRHRGSGAARGVRCGGRRGAPPARRDAHARRRASRRALDRGRLAAAAHALPQPERPPVTLAQPYFLLALVLVPLAIVGYVLLDRRRRRRSAGWTRRTMLPDVGQRPS